VTGARAILIAALLAACGGGGDDAPADALPRCPIGDPSAPAELEIVHLDRDNQVVTTASSQQVPLVAPPQGGWIVLLGARARNLDGCEVQLTTSFHDLCSPDIIKVDARPTHLDPTGDGWGLTSVTTFANLPFCPQPAAPRNLHDQPFVVTVTLEDLDGKRASRDITIVPVCPEGSESCRCQCDRDYVLGSCPPPRRTALPACGITSPQPSPQP
jgi:hypothetical protein